ncbi:MAG: tRNA lysidine(34) synthetase TilS [Planctomycetes bacterium]|nr:tRNA lysidine(34) synthetase TilS [Planctomycetota bacterium]
MHERHRTSAAGESLSERALAARAASRGARSIVAWSGGADSTYLLERLLRARANGAPLELTAAHVHHGLRGSSADADLETCIARARALGVELEIARLEPPRGAGETWARRARYEALLEIAARRGADAVLTAHHLDDQIETILWQLLRGARPSRARGMRRARRLAPGAATWLVRPLLDRERAELRSWLAERGLAFREDPTNADPELGPRNALRHRVIPALDALAPAGWKQRWARFFASEARASQRGEGALEHALLELLLRGAGLEPTGARCRTLRRKIRAGDTGTLLGTRFGFHIERRGEELRVRTPDAAWAPFVLPCSSTGITEGPLGTLELRELEASARESGPPTPRRPWLVVPRGVAMRWRSADPNERIWPPGAEQPRRLRGLLAGRGCDAAARRRASVLEIEGRAAWVIDVEVDRRWAWSAERSLRSDEVLLEARFEARRSPC